MTQSASIGLAVERARYRARRVAAAAIDPALGPSILRRPIFVVSPPRSGSTMLYDLLRGVDDVWGLEGEADHLWWKIFPYSQHGWSDFIPATPANVGRMERWARLVRSVRAASCGRGVRQAVEIARSPTPPRYLEKTIANCFRIDLLASSFPDAAFVRLVRHPLATIASMVEGWPYSDRFGKPQLTHLIPPDAAIGNWSFPAPPGWRDHVNERIEQVCWWSWREHAVSMLEGLSRLDPSRVVDVRYEDLTAAPSATVRRLLGQLGLKPPESRATAQGPPLSSTTVSAPRPDKWRTSAAGWRTEATEAIADVAEAFGYPSVE